MKRNIYDLVASYRALINTLAYRIRPERHKDPFWNKRRVKLLKDINERRMKDWINYPGRSKELALLIRRKDWHGTLFDTTA